MSCVTLAASPLESPRSDDASAALDLRCPISLELMSDPCILVQSGITYEKAMLERALQAHPGRDPQTNQRFAGAPTIVRNTTLKRVITQMSDAAAFNVPPWRASVTTVASPVPLSTLAP